MFDVIYRYRPLLFLILQLQKNLHRVPIFYNFLSAVSGSAKNNCGSTALFAFQQLVFSRISFWKKHFSLISVLNWFNTFLTAAWPRTVCVCGGAGSWCPGWCSTWCSSACWSWSSPTPSTSRIYSSSRSTHTWCSQYIASDPRPTLLSFKRGIYVKYLLYRISYLIRFNRENSQTTYIYYTSEIIFSP